MSEATPSVNKVPGLDRVSNRNRRLLGFGIFIAVMLIGVTFSLAYHNLSETREGMTTEMAERQKTIVVTRVETTDAWLKSLVEHSRRLVGSDLFQLFASEVDKFPGGVPLLFAPNSEGDTGEREIHAEQLSSQLPLMRAMLSEFVAYSGFSSARIVNSKIETYLTTEPSIPPLTLSQRRIVQKVIDSGALAYAPLEILPKGTALDIYLPIMAPSYQGTGGKPVAVLVLRQIVDGKLAEILAPGIVNEGGRKLKMVQKNDDIYQCVVPGSTILRQLTDFPVEDDGPLPFGLRKGFGESYDVYSSGIQLRSTGWWLICEHDVSLVNIALADRARTVYTFAGLVSLALVLLFSAVWWGVLGREQCTINAKMNDLLGVIAEQKRLLDGINSAISDPISLTSSKGIYRYVNTAFASAVGRKAEDVVGLDGPAVFGFDTAKRLNASDQHVLMTGESISVTEVLWLQSRRHHFQISKTPLREDNSRTPLGIVSVFRDITQLVETQERARRVIQQTIGALVRAIEEADPFLGGHSRIMGGIAALMAKQLRLSEKDAATIEAAANLSQIGKMFVPRDILLKPGALTPEEKVEMERHVEYAKGVLRDIEFDLPVVEAISQMNERLDGKGYPCGLSGEDISIHARVLAVANAFTAMARPRSYRPALPVAEAVAIFERQADSYDQAVVAALKQVIATPAGERLVEQAASSKAL